jgi:hypothetical protein
MRTLGALLIILALAGCGGTWRHLTATREQYLRDDDECKQENRAAVVVVGIPFGHTDQGAYRRCMELRGYWLE